MVIRAWRDEKSGEEHIAVRYDLSSLDPGVKAFARYARSQWSVENSLHWVLDVAFREDDCTIENPTAAANVSAMNRPVGATVLAEPEGGPHADGRLSAPAAERVQRAENPAAYAPVGAEGNLEAFLPGDDLRNHLEDVPLGVHV